MSGIVKVFFLWLCMHLEFSLAFQAIYSMCALCDAVVSCILFSVWWKRRIMKRKSNVEWNGKWQKVIESAVKIAISTIHFLIQFPKFYFLLFSFTCLSLFGISQMYTKLYHFTFDTVLVFLCVCLRAPVKTQTHFSFIAFCRKCWFYLPVDIK